MSVFFSINALDGLKKYFDEFPEIAASAASMAINDTVEREGMTLVKKDMRDQVVFPAGYLEGDRLKVTRKANKNTLEAVIRGRDRPTSLARFAPGQTPSSTRGKGVVVGVQRDKSRVLMRKAFLIRLANGNMGLAVRLKDGESLRNTTGAVPMGAANPGVYLLYGPSVDQVFRGVVVDRADDIATIVTKKFLRQFGRLSRG